MESACTKSARLVELTCSELAEIACRALFILKSMEGRFRIVHKHFVHNDNGKHEPVPMWPEQ